jgi:hypothetical protein
MKPFLGVEIGNPQRYYLSPLFVKDMVGVHRLNGYGVGWEYRHSQRKTLRYSQALGESRGRVRVLRLRGG